MSAAAARVLGRRFASSAVSAAEGTAKAASEVGSKAKKNDHVLNKGAKRDPELYILLTIMSGAFGMAGYHFASKPTSSSSESAVSMAEGTHPWQTEGNEKGDSYKYQYHPGGDRSKAPKNAPSALNTVIVPNVTLRKSQHDQFNKYGKDEYDL